MKVSILHYGAENHYLLGLVTGLKQFDDLIIEIVGSDNSEKLFEWNDRLVHRNLRKSIDPARPKLKKAINLLLFYFRLLLYCLLSNADIFHIQWETNFFIIDRLIFVPLLKLRGIKVVYTAHNADNEGRGEKRSILNKSTLAFYYSKLDAIIAHTPKVKFEIEQRFKIPSSKIEVIPHGINIINKTPISTIEARKYLGIDNNKKVLLCFGAIEPYKGIDLLLKSLNNLIKKDNSFYLVIAGRSLNKNYLEELESLITQNNMKPHIKFVNKFIPDDEVSYYFNAADSLVLPYRSIYQSGVLFLAYSFGLPVIATDVGSFSQDIIEGKTGFLAEPKNIDSLSNKIKEFYKTDLFYEKECTREFIIKYAEEKYSWDKIGKLTYDVYKKK
jgi:glycosyltransferase involved in cell wall biosynthesis